ncbi:MAG TPA: type II toxin-antitoxin system RelE/ParE family toxin [Actinomycetota bacterium]
MPAIRSPETVTAAEDTRWSRRRTLRWILSQLSPGSAHRTPSISHSCKGRLITLSLSNVAKGPWSVDFHPVCETWANNLDQSDKEALLAAIRVLRDKGPTLGRPLVDTVKTSRHPNMKELRPGSTGRTEIRLLFAFDRKRKAILLVGGDKSDDWKGWYTTNIPIADDRLDWHQKNIDEQKPIEGKPSKGGGRVPKGRRQR